MVLGQMIDLDAGAIVSLGQLQARFVLRSERAAIAVEVIENAELHPGKPRRRRGSPPLQCAMSRSVGRHDSAVLSIFSTTILMTSTSPVATTIPANTPTVSDSSRECSM